MPRQQRDLLTAFAIVLLVLLGLFGWGAVSRARQGPEMVVTEPDSLAAPAPSAPREAPSPAPPAASPATAIAGALRVHVIGAVRRPGVYALDRGARVIDAVTLAGGVVPDADTERINMADFLKDGEQVRIPRKGERPRVTAAPVVHAGRARRSVSAAARPAPTRSTARYPSDESPAPPAAVASASAASPPATAGGKVNLNTATREELDTLPGVGPATAEAIVDHRRQHGKFLRIEDIMEVRGIGEKKFEKMKDRLTVQ